MKKITAMVRPAKLEAVVDALRSEVDIKGLTVSETNGVGRGGWGSILNHGNEAFSGLVPNYMFEIVVSDEQLKEVIRTIRRSAKTGRVDDGKIFVSPVEYAIRIRNGDEGEKALE